MRGGLRSMRAVGDRLRRKHHDALLFPAAGDPAKHLRLASLYKVYYPPAQSRPASANASVR